MSWQRWDERGRSAQRQALEVGVRRLRRSKKGRETARFYRAEDELADVESARLLEAETLEARFTDRAGQIGVPGGRCEKKES